MASPIKRRGNKYYFMVRVPDADGVVKMRRFAYDTKQEAEQEYARIKHELTRGQYFEPEKLTVKDFLERWLAESVEPNRQPKTYERYEEIVRLHLVPALGRTPLEKLHPLQIQRFYAEKQKKLSARTVLHMHRAFRRALQQAIKWRLLTWNPADGTEPPRPEKSERPFYTEEEVARLLELAVESPIRLPALLAVSTGMRLGEILALRWSDVDLDTGLASVSRSLQEAKGELRFKSTKTGRGRPVVIPALTIAALREHYKHQREIARLLGDRYRDHDLIFPNDEGSPRTPDGLSRAWRRFIQRTELRPLHFHDLRHTHASLMGKLGVHAKVVSERLGHSTIAITMDLYSHVLPGVQDEAAAQFDALLRKAMDRK